MDISINWLRTLAASIEGTADELAAALSSRAVPVDRTEVVGEGLDDVVVGRVIEVVKHPDADRLSLCRVDAGAGEVYISLFCNCQFVQIYGNGPGCF